MNERPTSSSGAGASPSAGPDTGNGAAGVEPLSSLGQLDATLKRYVGLFEHAPVALVVLDADGRILQLNGRAVRLLGAAATPGAALAGLLDPGCRDALAALVAAPAERDPLRVALTGGEPGAPRPGWLEAWREPSDGTVVVALHDAPPAAPAAPASPVSAPLDSCLLAARSGAWTCDPFSGDLWLSEAAQVLFHAQADSTLERAMACFVDEGMRLRARRAIEAAANENRAFDCEADLSFADGSLRRLRIAGAPEQEAGRLRILGTVHVLSERRRPERPPVAPPEAPAADGAALLARSGHQVRTQLQAMVGYAHLLARDPAIQASAGAASRVARIDAAARDLLALVDGMQPPRPVEPAPPEAPPAAPQAGPRVVVYIEDNAVNAEMMVALLEARAPLHVEIAADGTSGIEAVRRLRPALLLLDLQLPDLDGFEVWRRLRADPETAGVPCIAVSGNAGEAEIRAALDAGMSGLLPKPVDAERLLQSVDRLVPGLTAVE